ncbi:MAG: hypothetical protein R6W78_03890 [Bacteroidales bacterium]
MTSKRLTSNTTVFYFLAVVVIVVAFLLLGGWPWLKSLSHGGRSMNMANLNWLQIIIGLGIGFVLGLLAGRRKW